MLQSFQKVNSTWNKRINFTEILLKALYKTVGRQKRENSTQSCQANNFHTSETFKSSGALRTFPIKNAFEALQHIQVITRP